MAQIIQRVKMMWKGREYDVLLGDNAVVLVGREGRAKEGYTLGQEQNCFGRLHEEWARAASRALMAC